MKGTLRWGWSLITNPELVWLNTDGSVAERERINRFRGYMTWWSIRPLWMHYALTTRAHCGCRRRFGLWRTIICSDHCPLDI